MRFQMRVLIIASYYPWSDNPSRGSFNERFACALRELCDGVDVLAPRPYAPPLLSSLVLRWRSYRRMIRREIRKGIPVYRPAYLAVPRLGGAAWADPGAFIWCRRTARAMHRAARFDAIISFDLVACGGLAWRIGRDLGIPASGWAIGGDVAAQASSCRRVLLRAVQNLDIVFYQSRDLLETVAKRLAISPLQMPPDRHVVLPMGVPAPPELDRVQLRNRLRAEWGVQSDQLIVLNVARIVREKGVFELLEAMSLVVARDPRLICVLVGSNPAFDETSRVSRELTRTPNLGQRVRLLPTCSPEKIWEYLCAADIFVFPSHREGMPNSLLEAMVMGLPAVAFSIPPLVELEAATGCMVLVPPLDSTLLARAIMDLAASPDARASIGEKGRSRVMHHFMLRDNTAAALRLLASVVAERAASKG